MARDSFPHMHPAESTSLTPVNGPPAGGRRGKRGKPNAPPCSQEHGNRSVSDGQDAVGRGCSKKRMLICNGLDRGSRFAPR